MNEISTLISTVGFPIAMTIAMGLYIKYLNDLQREDRKENSAKMDEIKNIVNNMSLLVEKLIIFIEKGDKNG